LGVFRAFTVLIVWHFLVLINLYFYSNTIFSTFQADWTPNFIGAGKPEVPAFKLFSLGEILESREEVVRHYAKRVRQYVRHVC
jgi:hypothetical protein